MIDTDFPVATKSERFSCFDIVHKEQYRQAISLTCREKAPSNRAITLMKKP